MKKQYVALIAVLSLIVIVLLAIVAYNEWPLMTGKKIVLATMPVDPFDPFMGQYMVINYDISRLSGVSNFNFKKGDTVYVLLKEDSQGIYRKESISNIKPLGTDFIKGTILDVYDDTARVNYGIERFFFERNANLPTTNITVQVAVANSGRAKLVTVLHNGEPITITYEKFNVRS